jgi:hypothetical protein
METAPHAGADANALKDAVSDVRPKVDVDEGPERNLRGVLRDTAEHVAVGQVNTAGHGDSARLPDDRLLRGSGGCGRSKDCKSAQPEYES